MTTTRFVQWPLHLNHQATNELVVRHVLIDESNTDQVPEWQQSPIAEINSEHPIVVVLPMEYCSLTRVQLPPKQVKHLQHALPFLVEEQIACDVERVHLAHGRRLADTQFAVAIIDKSDLQDLLQQFHSHGLQVHSIGMDALMLPIEENSITCFIDSQRSLIRYGEYQGLACDNHNLELTLESLLEHQQVNTLVVFHAQELSSAHELALQAIDSIGDTQVEKHAYEPFHGNVAQAYKAHPELNILQGEYTPAQQKQQSQIRWKPLATAAALLVGLHLVYLASSSVFLNYRAERYTDKSIEIFKSIFPETRTTHAIKNRVNAKLMQLNTSSSGSFLDTFGTIAVALKSGGPSIKLLEMRYSQNRQNITLEIQAGAIQQFEQLRQQLESKGLTSKLLSANEAGNGVRGRLQVEGV